MEEETDNHKGTWCEIQKIFCQEGHCSGCELYNKFLEKIGLKDGCVLIDFAARYRPRDHKAVRSPARH